MTTREETRRAIARTICINPPGSVDLEAVLNEIMDALDGLPESMRGYKLELSKEIVP